MKKIIFATSIIVTGLLFNSCTKNKVAEIKTFQFAIQPSEWVESGTVGTPDYAYIATHNIADITAAVVSNGAVLGYIGNSSAWIALPYTLTNTSWSTIINYAYTTGQVAINVKDTDLLSIAPAGTLTFKMVVLTEIEKNILIENNVDVKNYEEVSRVLEF